MKIMIEKLKQYLLTTLGVEATVRPWEIKESLPAYLRDGYEFYRMSWPGMQCLVMAGREDIALTPAVIGRQIGQVREKYGSEVVYGARTITSYNRKRLIDQKIPFIIPGNQMYLPFIGADLREHLRTQRIKKPVVTPATQMLLLYVLHQKEPVLLTPLEIARILGVSAMTMTRAFNELEALGIGEHSVAGKNRYVRFPGTRKELWEQILPYLRTPVQKRVYVTGLNKQHAILSGYSALASFSMLGTPETRTVALSIGDWKTMQQDRGIVMIPSPETGSVEIELWMYSPLWFAQDGCVDRFSLYLSMKDSNDERVQSALESLLGGIGW